MLKKTVKEIITNDQGDHTLVCPICREAYQHQVGTPVEIESHDSYEAHPGFRGNVLVIPFEGESCGHQWSLCIAFHKGNSFIFLNDTKAAFSTEHIKGE